MGGESLRDTINKIKIWKSYVNFSAFILAAVDKSSAMRAAQEQKVSSN
jgi:hypothetical protein